MTIQRATMAVLVAFSCGALAAQETPQTNDDEKAIRGAVASYVAAFNRGDAGAVARHWSQHGEWVSPSGERFKGREAIKSELEAYFDETAGRQRIEVFNPKVRLLAPTVAVEEGLARVTRPGEPPEETSYIAIHVKGNEGWKLESVRETLIASPASNYEYLQELEWMIGAWVDQGEEGVVETTCAWTMNKNFMTRSFAVRIEDRVEMQGTQVIGWDAARQQIRSWVFDSEGGFAEGVWTRQENRWIVKASHVLQGGEKASSMNIITYVDDDTFTWQSIGREIDGRLMPNVEPVTVVRKRS